VRETLTEGWSLGRYAETLGLSERHLRRLCLSLTGQSAHALLQAVRLREACRLPAHTRMQVQEVGFANGFDDPSHFARAFQRGMGLSPSAYRARLEGDDAHRP
jgi:AraC family transcriptional activator of pobA